MNSTLQSRDILDGRHHCYGSKFDHAAAPGRTVSGIVRDLDTGKPVVGALVSLRSVDPVGISVPVRVRTTTDKDGRYTLAGLPARKRCDVRVEGPADQPYLGAAFEVPRPAGVGPVDLDPKIKRGVWATVRVFDKADKQTIHAQVDYFVPVDSPNLAGLSELAFTQHAKRRLGPDGYRVAVLPGPGILAAKIQSGDHRYVSLASKRAGFVPAKPYSFSPQMYLSHMKIDVPADSKDAKYEIGLTRGED